MSDGMDKTIEVTEQKITCSDFTYIHEQFNVNSQIGINKVIPNLIYSNLRKMEGAEP